MKKALAVLLVALLGFFSTYTTASVLGIDLSAEFIKVAAIKPGNPFHIVVDEQAKRKVPLAVTFDDGERHFGNNAIGFGIRKPLDTYTWYHRLLGQTIESPRVKALQDIFPYKFATIPNRGGAVGVQKPNSDEIFTPEELVAMSLQHAMKIARDEDIDTRDAVITVPAWFSPVERQAVLDAAEIAGVTVLGLINDNTASAITYGIDRQYKLNETHTALFVDMGSAGLETTVVKFSGVSAGKGRSKGKVHGQATVLSSAWDAELGGLAFDKVIRDYLVTEFKKKYGSAVEGVEKNAKAMAKLLKQAVSSKVVLSANKDVGIRLESVFRDKDLDTFLTRTKFYELADVLLHRVRVPVFEALRSANVTAEALDAVVIIGGSVRIPGVQDELKTALDRNRLDQNINGDEAMAMGSVFRAANISTLFQVRPFGLADISNFEVNAAMSPLSANGSDGNMLGMPEPRMVSLFKKNQSLGKRAKIRFYEDKDLQINVAYANDAPTEGKEVPFFPLATYHVTGIQKLAEELAEKKAKAAENQTEEEKKAAEQEKAEKADKSDKKDGEEDNTHKPRLALSFQLDQSGVVRLVTAEATVEELADVPNAAFKKLFDARVTNTTRGLKRASFELDSATKAYEEAIAALEKLEKYTPEVEAEAEAEAEKTDAEKVDDAEKADDAEKTDAKKKVSTPPTEEEIATAKKAVEDAKTRLENAKLAHEEASTARKDANDESTISEPKIVRQNVSKSHPLNVVRNFSTGDVQNFVGVSPADLVRSKALLQTLSDADAARRARAAAFNDVEGNMYAIKNELYDDDFEQVTTEEQREKLRVLAEEADDWLYGDASNASLEELVKRARELQTALAPHKLRKTELSLRPLVISSSRTALKNIQERYDSIVAERSWLPEDIKKAVSSVITETASWITEKEEKQNNLEKHLDLVVTSDEITERVEKLQAALAKLENMKKPKEDKKKKDDKKKKNKKAKKNKKDEKASEEETEEKVSEEDKVTEDSNTEDKATESTPSEESESESTESPAEPKDDSDSDADTDADTEAEKPQGAEAESTESEATEKKFHDEL